MATAATAAAAAASGVNKGDQGTITMATVTPMTTNSPIIQPVTNRVVGILIYNTRQTYKS